MLHFLQLPLQVLGRIGVDHTQYASSSVYHGMILKIILQPHVEDRLLLPPSDLHRFCFSSSHHFDLSNPRALSRQIPSFRFVHPRVLRNMSAAHLEREHSDLPCVDQEEIRKKVPNPPQTKKKKEGKTGLYATHQNSSETNRERSRSCTRREGDGFEL